MSHRHFQVPFKLKVNLATFSKVKNKNYCQMWIFGTTPKNCILHPSPCNFIPTFRRKTSMERKRTNYTNLGSKGMSAYHLFFEIHYVTWTLHLCQSTHVRHHTSHTTWVCPLAKFRNFHSSITYAASSIPYFSIQERIKVTINYPFSYSGKL